MQVLPGRRYPELVSDDAKTCRTRSWCPTQPSRTCRRGCAGPAPAQGGLAGKSSCQLPDIQLLIDCPDHKGVIAAVSGFIALHNGNILSTDQYVSDPPVARFHEMEIEGQGFGLNQGRVTGLRSLAQHGMNWRRFADQPADGDFRIDAALFDGPTIALSGSKLIPRFHW